MIESAIIYRYLNNGVIDLFLMHNGWIDLKLNTDEVEIIMSKKIVCIKGHNYKKYIQPIIYEFLTINDIDSIFNKLRNLSNSKDISFSKFKEIIEKLRIKGVLIKSNYNIKTSLTLDNFCLVNMINSDFETDEFLELCFNRDKLNVVKIKEFYTIKNFFAIFNDKIDTYIVLCDRFSSKYLLDLVNNLEAYKINIIPVLIDSNYGIIGSVISYKFDLVEKISFVEQFFDLFRVFLNNRVFINCKELFIDSFAYMLLEELYNFKKLCLGIENNIKIIDNSLIYSHKTLTIYQQRFIRNKRNWEKILNER